MKRSMAYTTRRGTVAKKIRRGPGKRMVDGKSFRLADEVRYIQRRAAEHDERVVIFGQIVAFSTASGDAWLLDTSDHLAARLARDGDPEPIEIEDTETTFSIGWKGQYRVEGAALRVATIFDGLALAMIDGEVGLGRKLTA